MSELLKKKPRPIPILGGPGMGKTTISLTALHNRRVASRFGNRRWFVRCDGMKTRPELAAAIALALGIDIAPEVESVVMAELANERAALVLDNAETPLDADNEQVEKFLAQLAAIDSLALVVTIRGNHRPATVPFGATIEAKPLSGKHAREAFVAAAGMKFAKDPHLSQLLAPLQGAALPITLMARFAAESSPSLDLVLQRWEAKKIAILSTGTDRLSNVAISYELSLEALTPQARRFLSVLAMLPDGVAHVDLPAIFEDPERVVDELRGRALIEHEEHRVRMLAPLREFVVTAHPAGGPDEARAVLHYVGLAADEGSRVGATGGAEAVFRLAPEVANVEAMFTRTSLESPDLMQKAAYGFGELMRFTGLGSVLIIENVRERARSAGLTNLEARCSRTLGNVAFTRSELDIAQKRFLEALALYRECGSLIGEATCIRSLGNVALERSEFGIARERFEEALQLARKAGSLLVEATCIECLGDVALSCLNYNTAGEHYNEALPLYRQIGNLLGEANCIKTIGDIAFARSDYATARERFDEALPLYQKVGSLRGEASCIGGLGDIAYAQKNPVEASSRHRDALSLYEQIRDPVSIAEAHCKLARSANHDVAKHKHIAAAKAAWRSIGRDDLIAQLDTEFGSHES